MTSLQKEQLDYLNQLMDEINTNPLLAVEYED